MALHIVEIIVILWFFMCDTRYYAILFWRQKKQKIYNFRSSESPAREEAPIKYLTKRIYNM